MCQVNGCSKPTDARTAKWNVGVLCDHHFDLTYKACDCKDEKLTLDFMKIFVLLQHNTKLCLEQIEKLENEMQTARSANLNNSNEKRFKADKPNYLKVSRALEYYEGYCWWPANRLLVTGRLNNDDFFASGQYGHAKDSGPGPAHGEYSHRLQWHAISRLATNGFQTPVYEDAGWSHSPLQLFYELTQGATRNVPKGSAWAALMDAQKNQGWGNPDDVFKDVLNCKLPLTSGAMLRRMTKMGATTQLGLNLREKDFENIVDEFRKSNKVPKDKKELIEDFYFEDQEDDNKFKNLNGDSKTKNIKWIRFATSKFYVWQKSGAPPQAPAGLELALIFELYEFAITNELFKSASKQNYKTETSTDLLFEKDAPDKAQKINEARVKSSIFGFNTGEYSYNKNGAYPTKPQRY